MSSEELPISRKRFFGEFFGGLKRTVKEEVERRLDRILDYPIRPPGALSELEFLAACTRCDACIQACPYGALQRLPMNARMAANTPYIHPRLQPCMLCPDFPCIAACEPRALIPIAPSDKPLGRALVRTSTCLTYHHQVCSACYDACPIPERAIQLDADFHPSVFAACVGCGACEHDCPTAPSSIQVLSSEKWRIHCREQENLEKQAEDQGQ